MSVFLIDLPDYAPEEEQRVYMGDGSGGYVLAFPLLSAQRRMAFNIKKLPWPPIESTNLRRPSVTPISPISAKSPEDEGWQYGIRCDIFFHGRAAPVSTMVFVVWLYSLPLFILTFQDLLRLSDIR